MTLTLIDYMEYANDAAAQAAYVTNDAGSYLNTGGTITTDGLYTVHTFLLGQSGTAFTPGKSGNVAVLVVAGGGGGGAATYGGGGGGGGGVVYSASSAVTAQEYTVVVGDGGAVNTIGNNSSFNGLIAYGGGKGSADQVQGGNGGCGGGAGSGNVTPGGTGSQGYNGGSSGGSGYGGSGGGGGMGGNPSASNSSGLCGSGGVGYSSTIYDGSTKKYGGGGGGGRNYDLSSGYRGIGTDGGGSGGMNNAASTVGTANTGGGGGGSGGGNVGSKGGSGVVIIRCLTSDFLSTSSFQSYSEATIKTQGSYALKAVAAATDSLNKTLTKTFDPPKNLSGKTQIKLDMYSSRTGSNVKIGFHDSGGTTTEYTPNITSAGEFQTFTVDISGVSNANKDAIDSIILTQVNADSATTWYLDNVYATTSGARSFGVIII